MADDGPGNVLNRATPDEVIEHGSLRAVTYEIDSAGVSRETAPLMVSHVYGRIGATYPRYPDHAHYINLYIGQGLRDDLRPLLFPELLDAAHSVSTQAFPPKPFSRRHGVLAPMTPPQAEAFLAGLPMRVELFEIGPTDRPVEMFGVSVALEDAGALESAVASMACSLTWLTPLPR